MELGKKGKGKRTPVVSAVRWGAVRLRSWRKASRCLFLAEFLDKKSKGGRDNKDCTFVQFAFQSIFSTAAGSLRTN